MAPHGQPWLVETQAAENEIRTSNPRHTTQRVTSQPSRTAQVAQMVLARHIYCAAPRQPQLELDIQQFTRMAAAWRPEVFLWWRVTAGRGRCRSCEVTWCADEVDLLEAGSMIDAALENAATVAMSPNDCAVLTDSVEDELRLRRPEGSSRQMLLCGLPRREGCWEKRRPYHPWRNAIGWSGWWCGSSEAALLSPCMETASSGS